MEADVEHQLEVDEKEHALSVLKSLSALREKGEHCDLIIKVGEEELKVDRKLMIASSGFISSMFTHDTLERKTGVVDMKGVGFVMVKKCVDFIYTGKISISFSKCEDLLFVASLMQLWQLQEHIARFLMRHLSIGIFNECWNLAVKFDIENLEQYCYQFANENLEMLAKEKEFNELDADTLSFILGAKKSTSPGGEDRKVISILKWIKQDTENRRQDLIKLLKSVAIENVSRCYVTSLMEDEAIFYESAECVRMFFLASMGPSGEKRRRLDLDEMHKPNSVIVFNSQKLQAFTLSHEENSPVTVSKARLPISDVHTEMVQRKYTAVIIRSHVYVLMGNKKIFRLNVFNNEIGWVKMTDMLEEHGDYISSAVLHDFIFVAGELSMERYSLRDDKWVIVGQSTVDQMCFGRPCLVEHLGDIYAIGESSESSQKYSLESGLWSPFSPLPWMTNEYLSGVSLGENIYVMTSQRQSTGVYIASGPRFFVYKNSSKAWTAVTLPTWVRRSRLCTLGSYLMLFDDVTKVALFSVSKMEWARPLSSLQTNYFQGAFAMWLPSEYFSK